MKKKNLSFPTLLVAMAILFVMVGCNIATTSVGEEQTETQSIELGSAESVEVVIQFGAGELDISGGAANLMEGTFTYNVDEWQPEVEYSVDGTQGVLAMSHEGDSLSLPVGGELVNDWNLQFNNDVPIELIVQAGGSESVLDLSALDITVFTLETGAGVTTIDLTGSWSHDVAVTVEGGIGEITINLPADMGVEVSSETALVSLTTSGLTKNGNTYTNDAFGTTPYTLTLDLEAGVGSVNLTVAD